MREISSRQSLTFVNKSFSKEVMKRRFSKDRNKENKRSYLKQRNYCVSLIRKMKKYIITVT